MAKKIKRNVSEQGIDNEVYDTCRTAMAMCRGLIEDQLRDSLEEDLKMKGLLDMTWGLCYDAIELGEQQTECLNILLEQNKELIAKLNRIEEKMK